MIRLVMERSDMAFWPVLSLVIFVVSCAAMLIWLYRPGSATFYGNLSRLALGEGGNGTPAGTGAEDGKENRGVDKSKGGE